MTQKADNPNDFLQGERDIFKSMERLISVPRLKRYRRATTSKQDAIALYLWNIALCEALYPCLQLFEVSLRNATHAALSAEYGSPRWFMNMSVLTEHRHQNQVLDAIETIRKDGKGHFVGHNSDPDFPKEPNRIVAELSLGFWVNLFSDPYTHGIVSKIARKVFPNGPVEISRHSRQDVLYPRLQEVLRLRNRVFHHEPVYHWTLTVGETSLLSHYNRIIDVLHWISDTQPMLVKTIDRFQKVHNDGFLVYLDCVALAFLEAEDAFKSGT